MKLHNRVVFSSLLCHFLLNNYNLLFLNCFPMIEHHLKNNLVFLVIAITNFRDYININIIHHNKMSYFGI